MDEIDGIFLFPPTFGSGSLWLARTIGGTHDHDPLIAHGATSAEALRAVRGMLRYPALR